VGVTDALQFVLVPDGACARRVRRSLALRGAWCGVAVGTWGELVEQACRAYLVRRPVPRWEERLAQAVRALPGAFWSQSLEVDPEGTAAALGWELARLLDALGPCRGLDPDLEAALTPRGRARLGDLCRLHEAMGRVLPDGLAAVQSLLEARGADAVRRLAVHRVAGLPPLSSWQEALLAKIDAEAAGSADPSLAGLVPGLLSTPPAAPRGSALRHLQECLFVPEAPRVVQDDSVSFLGVRDHLEAVEVAAGMIAKAAAADPRFTAADAALLVPRGEAWAAAVRTVFRRAGLPVAGLAGPPPVRNLGAEAAFHFLVTRRRPAPAMALAALYASPLMPWEEVEGNRLARQVMEGEYDPRFDGDPGPAAREMLALLRERHETSGELREALDAFAALLDGKGRWNRHAEEARRALAAAAELLDGAGAREVPWEALSARIPQGFLPAEGEADLPLEGAAVVFEDEEPWRPARLLFVLGFSQGRYPRPPPRSRVFEPADLKALRRALGPAFPTPADELERRRELFRRQLGAARERAVFVSPLRGADGRPLAPSGTLALAARLFRGAGGPRELLLELDRAAHRARVPGLAVAPPEEPEPPRAPDVRDPHLGGCLLPVSESEGKPLTPSGLETLMVSPLAWFLEREGIVPLDWAPETLDPKTKGTLAHAVFERLFAPGAELPEPQEVEDAAARIFHEVVVRRAPFLLAPEWYVERRNLLREIAAAALCWREFLARSKARILAVEATLSGSFEGVPVRGRTDLVLVVPPERLFVVDYKKARAAARRRCMEQGYDLQTSLYRRMLASGRVEDGAGTKPALAAPGARIGVAYYMMDDQRLLVDTPGWIRHVVPGIEEVGGEIFAEAEALCRERLAALRAGRIPLNRADDGERFEKLGVKTYALALSPLVALFVHPAGESPP